MAEATGSSIKKTFRAPAVTAASTTARDSTLVIPEGTQTATRGLKKLFSDTFLRK